MTVAFELLATDPTGARAGVVHTRRGLVKTPVFMPVATYGAFRTMGMDDGRETGAGIILSNTYHLMLRPGPDVLRSFGGIHKFMHWDGPVLTDSGGFQIFSLPGGRTITEKGAHFRAAHDNSRHLLSPEHSIGLQQAIGSDIMMVLDVCIKSTTDEAGTRDAMDRTHRWALRSLETKNATPTGQALFAIVQGGVHTPLREASAEFLTQHPFDGFAIGGLAVGETKAEREAMTAHTARLLPPNKPRYLMGVGTPTDLMEAVKRGVDMFDCILPGKMAQQGYSYTFNGIVRLARVKYQRDERPIEEGCDCRTCAQFSRGYLHHLLRVEQVQATRLVSIHNVRHYLRLMERMRGAILEGTFEQLYDSLIHKLRVRGESVPDA